MSNIKIIALDMDDTLLNSEKHLSNRNKDALQKASELGIQIVPATGRLYTTIPEEVRELDFINYAIVVNGASIYDVKKKEYISEIAMPISTACRIMEYAETLPVIFDAYIDGKGFMNAAMYETAKEWVPEPFLTLVMKYRRPVPEIKQFIKEFGKPVQKIQMFVNQKDKIRAIYDDIKNRFPETDVTSSWENNIEICDSKANKGYALLQLADLLGIAHEDTMAFGDGGNDIQMIKMAGLGVAMENATDNVKKVAKYITLNCNEDGVADAIEKLILG